jgi:hypothetical protein
VHQYTILDLPETALNPIRVTHCRRPLSSMINALAVNTLAMILAWQPSITMALGKIILRRWPGFRRS